MEFQNKGTNWIIWTLLFRHFTPRFIREADSLFEIAWFGSNLNGIAARLLIEERVEGLK